MVYKGIAMFIAAKAVLPAPFETKYTSAKQYKELLAIANKVGSK